MKNLSKTKCLQGLYEFKIEPNGRVTMCNAGNPNYFSPDLNVKDFNFNLFATFRSKKAREMRKVVKRCKVKCQQMVYFRPSVDNLFLIIKDLIVLSFQYLYLKIRNIF
jgi:hypothetical protein